MAIDSKAAAKIAKEAGLSLSDARALAVMSASDETEATELADIFATTEAEHVETQANR